MLKIMEHLKKHRKPEKVLAMLTTVFERSFQQLDMDLVFMALWRLLETAERYESQTACENLVKVFKLVDGIKDDYLHDLYIVRCRVHILPS